MFLKTISPRLLTTALVLSIQNHKQFVSEYSEWPGLSLWNEQIGLFSLLKKKNREATIRQVNVSVLEQSCQDIRRMVL